MAVAGPPELPFAPTIPNLIHAQAARFADRDFVVDQHQRLTYRDADTRSAALAKQLVAAGVGKGTRVAMVFPSGVDFIVAFFALARIGAVAMPFSTLAMPPELHTLLRQADAQLLLTTATIAGHDMVARFEEAIPELSSTKGAPLYLPSVPMLRDVWIWNAEALPAWARGPADIEVPEAVDDALLEEIESEVTPGDALCMVFTSGVTGEPKGALHCHGAFVRHSANLAPIQGLLESDRLYTTMPMFWVGGITVTTLALMHLGATVLCEERLDPPRTLDLIERERATLVVGWQYAMTSLGEDPSFPQRDLSSVRDGPLLTHIDPENTFVTIGTEVRHNSLGMTETSGPHTYAPPDMRSQVLPEKWLGSFGPPIPGVEHRIADPVTGETLPDGVEGEVCVRGYSLMLGLNKRERHEAFDRDGWYHTGDRGYFKDGLLFFKGRLTEMIKTKGANVAPREVELVLEKFPEVRHAIVVGVPDPELGEEVVATIVLEEGATLDAEELTSRAKRELASYKVPRRVIFTANSELPMTSSGKVDRRRLQAELTT